MAWTRPEPPTWVRRFNAHADMVGGANHLISLDPNDLLSTARAMTGLDDFGDDGSWQDHFNAFTTSLRLESDLTLIGRVLARHDILVSLKNRLKLQALWKSRPEILGEEIHKPVFIVGAARTGTTLMLELFAADPANRTPATWELYHPVEALSGTEMMGPTDLAVRSLHSLQPEYGAMHSSAGDLANECVYMAMPTFLGEYWSGAFNVPSYQARVAEASHLDAYTYHKKFLQTLQQRLPSRRWVLKSPTHLGRLKTLLSVYPDARIIQTHRDPLRTIPSLVSLVGTLTAMRCEKVDVANLGEALAEATASTYERQMEDRISGALPNEAFIDVRYADLVADPLATMIRIYDSLGWAVTDAAKKGFIARINEPKREGQTGHKYSLEDLGLNPRDLRTRFEAYQANFGLADEEALGRSLNP